MGKSLRMLAVAGAALATVLAGSTHAQESRTAAPIEAAPVAARGITMVQAGRAIDRANRMPEFQKALRPDNLAEIQSILVAAGLPKSVPVKYAPMDNLNPTGSFNCVTAPITVYYPNPPYSWPNTWRTIIIVICQNDAGGQTSYW